MITTTTERIDIHVLQAHGGKWRGDGLLLDSINGVADSIRLAHYGHEWAEDRVRWFYSQLLTD